MNALCMRLAVAVMVVSTSFASEVGAGVNQDPARRQAEDLAGAASKEFDAVLERQRVAQAPAGRPDTGSDARSDTGQSTPASGEGTGSWGWLERPRQEFQLLMQMLARGRSQPQEPVADLGKGQAQETHLARPGSADSNAAAKVDAQQGKAADQGSARIPNAQATAAGESKKVAEASKKQTDKKAAGSSPPGPSGTPAPSSDAKPSLTRDARPGAAIKTAPEARQAQGPKQPPDSKADASSRKTEAPKSPRPVGDAPSSADQGKAAAPPGRAPGSTGAAAPKAPAAAPPRAATPDKAARATKRAAAQPGRAASTSGRTCPAAGRAIRAPGWYVVRKGDTLSAIARRHYGSARFYTRIRAANRERIRSADRIHPCQRVYLPRIARR